MRERPDPDGKLVVNFIEVLTSLARSGRDLDALTEAMLGAASASLMVAHGPLEAAERLRDLADRIEHAALERAEIPGSLWAALEQGKRSKH